MEIGASVGPNGNRPIVTINRPKDPFQNDLTDQILLFTPFEWDDNVYTGNEILIQGTHNYGGVGTHSLKWFRDFLWGCGGNNNTDSLSYIVRFNLLNGGIASSKIWFAKQTATNDFFRDLAFYTIEDSGSHNQVVAISYAESQTSDVTITRIPVDSTDVVNFKRWRI